jgi:hypothetical protein
MILKTYILPLYLIVVLVTTYASAPLTNQSIAAARKMASGSLLTGELIKPPNQTDRRFNVESGSVNASFNACTLITQAEIEAVQGETVKEAKSSSRISGSLLVSQCFYQLATYSKSVSLEITQSNPDNLEKYNLRNFWKEKFNTRIAEDNDREKGVDKETAEKRDDNKESNNKPKAVQKLGDEAFLVGNRITGALYVLKKNTIIRISIGGAEDELTKIKKLRILAQKTLKRV